MVLNRLFKLVRRASQRVRRIVFVSESWFKLVKHLLKALGQLRCEAAF